MESVCYLKAIDNLVCSTMDTPQSGTAPFSISSTVIDAIGGDLTRISAQRFHDVTGHTTALKRRRTECFANSRQLKEHLLTSDGNAEASEKVLLSRNNCLDSSASKSICRELEMQYDEIRSSPLENSEVLKLNFNFLPARQMGNSLFWCTRSTDEVTMRSLSCPTLGASSDRLKHGDDDCSKEMIQTSGYEPEVQRCRSLPCRMTPDHHKNGLQRYFFSAPGLNPRVNLSELSTVETVNGDNEPPRSARQSVVDGNDKVDRIDDESCSSGPATPASCFIDVEDDTTPCSPLNLTTNDNECHDSINDISDDISNCSEKIADTSSSSLITRTENISKFHKCDEFVFHTEPRKNKTETTVADTSTNETLHDKKTNFSIDAILRPDFGVIRSTIQASDQLQQRHVPTSRPRFRDHIKSSHSAFTAVDLSTRSRSDSLSSPSCSSSSPSPPLSTSSPSPLLKSEHKHSVIYDKHYIGQENILLASKLFPEPNKDFHNFLNAHIQFMNPLHTNSFKSFPFLYTSQNGHPAKQPVNRNSHDTSDYRTKTDNGKNISKLLGRSFYPFVSETHSNNPMIKLSAQQESHIKTGSGTAFHVFGQNKHRQHSIDLLPPSKSEKSHNINSQSKSATRNNDNVAKSDTNMSANCKDELKDEKTGGGDDKSANSSNPLWPAWVFCTRYSDRPSSGPRSRKPKRSRTQDEKRPRTAFTNDQLGRLKREFEDCRYLTETRRKHLADELGLTESQIKIWFQNKRAKIKKSVGVRNPLAMQLMEQGLYNHATVKSSDDSS